MKTPIVALVLSCLGMTVGQFIYEALKSNSDYEKALERSFFLSGGAVVYYFTT